MAEELPTRTDLSLPSEHPVPLYKQHQLTLTVVWSRAEPWLVGAFFVPGAMPFQRRWEGQMLLRRVDEGVVPPENTLKLYREGFEALDEVGYVRCDAVSREALHVWAESPERLWLRQGRMPLTVEQEPVLETEVRPGELIELGSQLMLQVVVRDLTYVGTPLLVPPLRRFELGAADELGMVGEGPGAWRLRRALVRQALGAEHVLILGETGTGKERVAQGLVRLKRHQRPTMPFQECNCANLLRELAPLTLFGGAKDYPNPGTPAREGLVESADKGILFLDEVGDLPEAVQPMLFRFLQDGSYQRLGQETRRQQAVVKVLAATDQPLSQLRPALLHRFPVHLELASLKARHEDIPLLLQHLLRSVWQSAERKGVSSTRAETPGAPVYHNVSSREMPSREMPSRDMPSRVVLHRELVRYLCAHRWEGNMRELDAFVRKHWPQPIGSELRLPSGLPIPSKSRDALRSAPGRQASPSSAELPGVSALPVGTAGELEERPSNPTPLGLESWEVAVLEEARACQFRASQRHAPSSSVAAFTEQLGVLLAHILHQTHYSVPHAALILAGSPFEDACELARQVLLRFLADKERYLEQLGLRNDLKQWEALRERYRRRYGLKRSGWLELLFEAILSERIDRGQG